MSEVDIKLLRKVQIDEDTTAKDIVVKFYHAQLGGSRRAQMLNGR